jgi:hypothetical protein
MQPWSAIARRIVEGLNIRPGELAWTMGPHHASLVSDQR